MTSTPDRTSVGVTGPVDPAGPDVPGELGDAAFAALAERHRGELHVHCYRMLASFHEADDAVQETYLRAWRRRGGFEGVEIRAWLYRIATNVCLDMLRSRSRRVRRVHSFPEVPWIEPYPDALLDVAAVDAGPDAIVVARETIELAFLVALQVLPPRQRATLIARDVLGWPASETAVALETTTAAVNSALQRARTTMREHLPRRRSEWTGASSAVEQELLERFIDAHERCDAAAAIAIAAEDIRVTMPPYPWFFDGVGELADQLEKAFGEERDGDWRLLPTRANRMPTAASYLRRPGDTVFRAFKFDLLRVEDGVIAEVTTLGPELFETFGLPETLS
jgi:RNA polymerase sigma-70 factor (ECF subfamily)